MTKYLFVGGPRHGEAHLVEFDRDVVRVMGQPQGQRDEHGLPILGAPAVPLTYRRAEVTATDRAGDPMVCVVYADTQIPTKQLFDALFANALMGAFMSGILQIVETPIDAQPSNLVPDRDPGRAGEVDPEASQP